MVETNPLRYRGYYYDTESGLYYLQSRYYDPAVCRFINADTTDVVVIAVSPEKANWDKNLFAYCDNDPVNRKDDGGELWEEVIAVGKGIFKGALIFGAVALGVAVVAAVTVATGGVGTAVAATMITTFAEVSAVTFFSATTVGVTAIAVGEAASAIEYTNVPADPKPKNTYKGGISKQKQELQQRRYGSWSKWGKGMRPEYV